MDFPSPPVRAHIPASSFPAATAPAAQGAATISSPPMSPFESPNVSRPPSPTTAASSTMFLDDYSRSGSLARTSNERSISRSKDPLFKQRRNYDHVESPSLLSRALNLLHTNSHSIEEQRGRRRSVSHVAGEEIELGNLHIAGGPAARLHSTAASIKSSHTGRTLTKGRRTWVSRDTAQLCVSFAMIFMVGSNDSATGANLPSMQAYYGVSYDEISIVFLSNVAGYFISCVSSSFLSHHLGLRYALVGACAAWTIGCIMLLIRPPFPIFIISLAFLGFGGGLYDALLTTVVSHDENSVLMSWMYSCFGFGAAVAPIVIGTFVDKGISWNKYYYLPVGLAITLAILAHLVFQGYEAPSDEHALPPVCATGGEPSAAQTEGEVYGGRATMSASARMRRALSLRVVWIGFLLIMLAFGTGDTLSAWMTTYLSEAKGAPEAASRYMLSGLWGGIAAGRVIIPLLLSDRLGERTFSIVMLLLASGFLSICWAVKSYKIDAVALALVGTTIGPVTPHVLSMVGARVPPSLKASVMSLTIGCGLVGSGAGPLLFGLVAGRGLLSSLPGVLIVTSLIAGASWMLVPRNTRRED